MPNKHAIKFVLNSSIGVILPDKNKCREITGGGSYALSTCWNDDKLQSKQNNLQKTERTICYLPNSRHSGPKQYSFKFHTIYFCIFMWHLCEAHHYLTLHLYLLLSSFPTPYENQFFFVYTNPFCIFFLFTHFSRSSHTFSPVFFAYVERTPPHYKSAVCLSNLFLN